MRPSTLALVLIVGVGATSRLAVAKQPAASAAQPAGSSAAAEEASQRFQRAVKLYRERSFDAALAEFNRAYELAPDYRVLYNMGQVQAERADYVAAVKFFRQYLKDGADAIGDARLTEVQGEIARLEGRIAKLNVVANVDDAELVIDGDPVGTLPLTTVPVNAGVRRVVVRKKGYESSEQRLTLTGGEEKTLNVKLQSDGNAPLVSKAPAKSGEHAAAREAQPQGVSPVNTWFWISLAATGVAAGTTATFALLAQQAESKFSDELGRFPGSASRIDDARTDMKRLAFIADACGALTVLGIGATVYFAVKGAPRTEQKDGARAVGNGKPGPATWQTGPLGMSQPGVGWQVSGRF